MKFYDSKTGKIIKRKGKLNIYREDWRANSIHDVFKNKNVIILTNGIRPWNKKEKCGDLICEKCKKWFKVKQNGFELNTKRYDLWECPSCKSNFLTE